MIAHLEFQANARLVFLDERLGRGNQSLPATSIRCLSAMKRTSRWMLPPRPPRIAQPARRPRRETRLAARIPIRAPAARILPVPAKASTGKRTHLLADVQRATESYTSTGSGNTIEGTSSSSQTGSNSYQHVDKSDTYSDGTDSQSVDRDGTGITITQSSNSITGGYSSDTSGTVVTTVSESGDRGTPYTMSSTDTYIYSTEQAGNSYSGDYNNRQHTSSDSGSQTTSGTADDGSSYTNTVTNNSLDGNESSGNSISGAYTNTVTNQEDYASPRRPVARAITVSRSAMSKYRNILAMKSATRSAEITPPRSPAQAPRR